MQEINNFNEIPELFPWEPMFNKVIITLNTEKVDHNLVLSENTMSEIQNVIAVGPYVQHIKPGDKILLDMEKMMVRENNPNDIHDYSMKVKIDPVEHEGVMYGMIEDRLIKARYKA